MLERIAMLSSRAFFLCTICLQAAVLAAQTPPPKAAPPKPDTLVLNDDERLIGHLVRSNGSSVVFKSDLLGEITVDWSKIKELHTSGRYAVVPKNVKLTRHGELGAIPRGSLNEAGQTITVGQPDGAPAKSIPVADTAQVLPESVFDKDVVHGPGLLQAWTGAVTAGATVVQATQESRAFTGAFNLVRAVPTETWLGPGNRTLVDFSASEGFVSQPNTPKVKTEIVHAHAERDQYFSGSRVYGFGQAIFDHNFSQGLDLQQNFGGGIGYTAIKQSDLTLDLKGSANFVRQTFAIPGVDHNLAGSTFAESLWRKFPRGMTLLQQFTVSPAWNELHAWMATASASLTVPVYDRLSFSIGLMENFLNDPAPGFKKNSFQGITGLTYSFK
jgi:uncharacterized protein DUF481